VYSFPTSLQLPCAGWVENRDAELFCVLNTASPTSSLARTAKPSSTPSRAPSSSPASSVSSALQQPAPAAPASLSAGAAAGIALACAGTAAALVFALWQRRTARSNDAEEGRVRPGGAAGLARLAPPHAEVQTDEPVGKHDTVARVADEPRRAPTMAVVAT